MILTDDKGPTVGQIKTDFIHESATSPQIEYFWVKNRITEKNWKKIIFEGAEALFSIFSDLCHPMFRNFANIPKMIEFFAEKENMKKNWEKSAFKGAEATFSQKIWQLAKIPSVECSELASLITMKNLRPISSLYWP